MHLATSTQQMSKQLELPLASDGEAVAEEWCVEDVATGHRTEGSGTDQLMELIVDRDNCKAALRRVRSNDGSPGMDGMTVDDLLPHLREHWPALRAALLDGSYQPAPVRQQLIPKDNGGVRKLGIPTVLDRFIQLCILLVLEPLYEPSFSASSYGYRPGRSAIAAVKTAQQHLQNGRRWVVEVDLEKFFDRVNHDILMGRIARRINDKRLLRLIRRYLNADILADGVVIKREEGTPQGGPLSPLLANILLDEVDQELERSGHAFVRYADDCNVYVQSQRAGDRVLERLRKLYGKLRLTINESKSAVRPWKQHTLLGYTFRMGKGSIVLRRVSNKAVGRFKQRVRKLTRRSRGRSLRVVIKELRRFVIGWKSHFHHAENPTLFNTLDGWIARRLRMYQLKQWKNGRAAYRGLRAFGVGEPWAASAAAHLRSWWATSKHCGVQAAMPRAYFDALGVPRLAHGPVPLFESPDA